VQSDGRIIVGGKFTSVNGIGRNNIARLNVNGTLDESFNPGTGIDSSISTPSVRALAVQSDGRIIVGGEFTSVNGVGRNNIARLNANGTLDGSFDAGTGANDTVQALAVQPDGKVLMAGFFTNVSGVARSRVARLNANGSLDTGFAGGGANDVVFALVRQPDGRIVIGGNFTSAGGSGRNRIARLTANGSLDTSFDPGSGVTGGSVLCLALQSNGRVLLGGSFTTVGGTVRWSLARLFGGESGGGSCTYTIVPTSIVAPAGGTTGTITVTAGTSCAWTATSNVPWATITSGASGSGNGTVGYAVSANTGAPRTGTLTIAGQTFTIEQAAGDTGCFYTVAPSTLNVGGDAVPSATVTVTTGAGCAWEATVRNTDAPWVKLVSAQLASGQVVTPRMVGELGDVNRRLALTGTGSATVTLAVGRNPRTTARTGTVLVAGQVVTVTQAGGSGSGVPLGVGMAMFRPSNGYMYLKNRLISDFADQDFFYGTAGDVPIAGDWDGDGIDTPGIYRNVNGVMTFFLINNNTGGFADVSFGFGQPGDLPIAGDWDGNGTVTCGVYRPGNQTFLLRNANAAGSPDLTVVISGAQASDRPVAGRWVAGSATTGVGLYRPSNGQFLLKNTNVSGSADATFVMTTTGTVVAPVAGDWTRQGFATVGVVVNLGGTIQFQLRNSNTAGPPELRVNYGAPGDVPLVGNWDGQVKLPPVSVP
jgi:delta-60 repeat domain